MRSPALVLLALAFACGGSSKAPPSVPSTAMPSGAQLLPYAAGSPGLARPTGMDLVNGRVYIALGNYDAAYVVRGPGLLASLDPTTGNTQVIDIGGTSGTQCQEPYTVRDSGGKIYATCSGYTDYSAASPATTGTAIVEVDPATNKLTRIVSLPTSPSGLAIASSRIWFGDAFSGAIYAIDRSSFSIVAGPISIPCPNTGTYQTTNDVILVQGDLYAACSNNTGGILSRLDSNTGTLKMQADSGPTAVAFTQTSDGRIAVISGADSKLRLVTIGSSSLTTTEAYTYQGTETMQDIKASGHYLFTTSSGTDTVQRLDLSKPQAQMLVGEASMGTGAVPYNILPLDDDQALVSNQTGNTIVSVSSDCSSGRACWTVPK